ncbi:MAG: PEP-CTERM sorting domain-containing protein [Candidatus Korobacteraceae bacterium]
MPARASIVNGDFETGDFTGWDINDSVVPTAIPISAAVSTFNGSQVAQMQYAGDQAGILAGAISQDFVASAGQLLKFQMYMRLESDAATGQPSGNHIFRGSLTNLDTNSTLPFVTYTTPGTGPFMTIFNFGTYGINTPLSTGNYRLRFSTELNNVAGINTQYLFRLDNVRLVPEPATWITGLVGALALTCVAWRRSRQATN